MHFIFTNGIYKLKDVLTRLSIDFFKYKTYFYFCTNLANQLKIIENCNKKNSLFEFSYVSYHMSWWDLNS